jgi:hypothetical protein
VVPSMRHPFLTRGAFVIKQSSRFANTNFSRLTCYQYLNLSGTRVSDAGLVHLKGLTKLSHLQLFATQASCAGVQELKQAVPSLVIVR